jgi:hypothetical protein
VPRLEHRLAVASLLLVAACGGGGGGHSDRPASPPPGVLPGFEHVIVVVFENQNYSSIIGNGSMPYLNGLASANSLATSFYANTHPSIGNYFVMTTGGIVSDDDDFSGITSVDNVVRELLAAGKTWKLYAQSLPAVGWMGGDVYPYIKHHNPFAYVSDVVGSAEAANMVSLTQFAADLANDALPNFSFIVPDNQHNMHDCPAGMSSCSFADKAANTDRWLESNVGPLLANADFRSNGFVVITFDESGNDDANGGGRIATLLVGPRVKQAYEGNGFYQHEALLRLWLEALGVTSYPGQAANTSNMSEFF